MMRTVARIDVEGGPMRQVSAGYDRTTRRVAEWLHAHGWNWGVAYLRAHELAAHGGGMVLPGQYVLQVHLHGAGGNVVPPLQTAGHGDGGRYLPPTTDASIERPVGANGWDSNGGGEGRE